MFKYLIPLLLIGCAEKIDSYQLQKVEEICSQHNKIHHLELAGQYAHITCQDGYYLQKLKTELK